VHEIRAARYIGDRQNLYGTSAAALSMKKCTFDYSWLSVGLHC